MENSINQVGGEKNAASNKGNAQTGMMNASESDNELYKIMRRASIFVLVGGIISYIALVEFQKVINDEFAWFSLFTSLPVLVVSYFFYAIGNCVAAIAKNIYIQKEIIVNTIDKEKFEEIEKNNIN